MRMSLAVIALVLLAAVGLAQDAWRYERALTFPPSDTAFIRPYFATVTASGRLYVLSSSLTDGAAHNAIYTADSGDTELRLMVDYARNGDSDTLTGNIGQLRGIASIGTDVIVNASAPYPRNPPNTVATLYLYPRGDTAQVLRYGFYFGSAGHGTYNHGIAITMDSIAYMGVSALATGPGPGPRLYNLSTSRTTPSRGSWINAPTSVEPGGIHTGGFDVIRDCAVHPRENYNDTNTVWFTSRNSLSGSQLTGGIAVWRGGSQVSGGNYRGQRVQDPFGLLALGTAVSSGIAVDREGRLWVAGIDSTRRWVKAFDVSGGIFATEVDELPSSTSVPNPVPTGAPMVNPVDVALSADARAAYVPDASARLVWKFRFGPPVSVTRNSPLPERLQLHQNFPNPFNPATTISFTLPQETTVRLVVTNMLGQRIATLVDGVLDAGKHVRVFDASNLPTGLYFATLDAGDARITRPMMYMR